MLNRWAIAVAVLYLIAGCSYIPQVAHQPVYHNPFPQLKNVGVAPFMNHSTEPTLDGRQVALAYAGELQNIPGFDVAPMGIIEITAKEMNLDLTNKDHLRIIGNKLKLDAIVVGSVVDYTPYYPPRLSLRVDWYAMNPGYHPIPTGYGLPWGTPEEEEIPQSLVNATEFELAAEQLKTQTPDPGATDVIPVPTGKATDSPEGVLAFNRTRQSGQRRAGEMRVASDRMAKQISAGESAMPEELAPGAAAPLPLDSSERSARSLEKKSAAAGVAMSGQELPADWPNPAGLIPPPPSAHRPVLQPNDRPVLTHTRSYNGNDVELTKALESYAVWRDDARYGGWQAYLQRSEDFLRFCCHMHITEMLTARGGAGESRVVWRWPERR